MKAHRDTATANPGAALRGVRAPESRRVLANLAVEHAPARPAADVATATSAVLEAAARAGATDNAAAAATRRPGASNKNSTRSN